MLTFVQANTAPDIAGFIHLESDEATPADLTGATIRFQMRKPQDRRFTVNALADIVGAPTDGNVKYSWGPTDLAVTGDYQVQWEITYPDGKVQTTTPPDLITVRRN